MSWALDLRARQYTGYLSLVRDARLYAVVRDLLDAGLRPVPLLLLVVFTKG